MVPQFRTEMNLSYCFTRGFSFLFNLFTVNKSHFAAVYYCMCVCACDVWVNIYSPICPIDLFLCRFPILIKKHASILLFWVFCFPGLPFSFLLDCCSLELCSILGIGIVHWKYGELTVCIEHGILPAVVVSRGTRRSKRLLLRSVWPEGTSLLWHTVECAQFSKRDWAKMN